MTAIKPIIKNVSMPKPALKRKLEDIDPIDEVDEPESKFFELYL